MRSTLIIFRKEMRSYFTSPIAYMMLTSFTFLYGIVFAIILNNVMRAHMQMQFQMHAQPMNVNEDVVKGLLSVLEFISFLFIPLITMRLFSEEKRTGTFELLATSPLRDIEIILGKWLAAWAFYGCLLLAGSLNLIFLFVYSHPDWKPLLSGYAGLMLLVGCMLSIGTLISSLTKNQIIAAVMTFCAYFALWLISSFGQFATPAVASILTYLSVGSHAESFINGVLEIKDVVFYVTFIFLALFLTDRYLESLRWRS